MPFDCLYPQSVRHIFTLTHTDTKMRDFQLDMSKGPQRNGEIVPPPWFSTMDTPFNYA